MGPLEIAVRFIEHAPDDSGPIAEDLVGWRGKGVDVCSYCAGRIMARGCPLSLVATVPVWKPDVISCELCRRGYGVK